MLESSTDPLLRRHWHSMRGTHLPAKYYRWFPSLAYRTPSSHHGGGLGISLGQDVKLASCSMSFLQNNLLSVLCWAGAGLHVALAEIGDGSTIFSLPKGITCFLDLEKFHSKSDLENFLI
uniref:Uncharacterized protein n=4 Tax=Macaca TaxID=9539 RepID=A0A5F7ZP89_MACMU